MHPLEEFIAREVARKGQALTEINRDEAIEVFSQLTKHLAFWVDITDDDGDMVGFKITTRFHLSRSELREARREVREEVHGDDRERPRKEREEKPAPGVDDDDKGKPDKPGKKNK